MNAVIKDENSKEGAFGWLQFEKKGLQELQRLALRAPMAMGVLLYLVNNMGRSNALAVSQGAMSKKLGISVRAVAGAVATSQNHNFIEVVKVGNMNVYRINSRVAWQGKRGERFAAFNAEILAFESEQPEGFDTLPAAEVRSQTPERGTPARWERRTSPARPTGNGSAMSLPLPPECWPLQLDDVVVLIEGVAFIETKEEAARLVAEGKARYPEWNPDDGDYDIEP